MRFSEMKLDNHKNCVSFFRSFPLYFSANSYKTSKIQNIVSALSTVKYSVIIIQKYLTIY